MIRSALLVQLVLTLLLAAWTFAKDEPKDDMDTVVGIDLGTTYSWYVKNKILIFLLNFNL